MLLLVVVAMIAQPNTRVLEDAVAGLFDRRGGDEPKAEARVDQLTVDARRVSGRVHNPSAVTLRQVEVTVRLVPGGDGASRQASATVYGLAPGTEAWFGIPLVGGPAVGHVELVDVRATAGADGAERRAEPQRRNGGMRDVERTEREMKLMEEATRAATGGQPPP